MGTTVTSAKSPPAIAVIGATGAVGREMVSELSDSDIIAQYGDELHIGLFASERSAGEQLNYKGQSLTVEIFQPNKLVNYDYVLMSAGGTFSKTYSPQLKEMGIWVIDNSSAFRMDADVPLVVPEVNPQVLLNIDKTSGGIIANPNCSTIQLVVNLAPLERLFGIEQVIVSTYQSVSGAGWKGIQTLSKEVASFDDKEPIRECNGVFALPIAFNLVADIGGEGEDGHTSEEMKMVFETQKILSRKDLSVMATTVRVPVYYGHGQTLVCKLKRPVSTAEVVASLKDAAGVELCGARYHDTELPKDKHYLSQLTSPRGVHGRTTTQISRIRLGQATASTNEWVQMWNVADNLKKGAATNAVQILEHVLKA
ncbi:MAG: aspartate-semialdehyde dehydrogenase [Proteobacteria bacterium]|nr:aspartate-semialdehyde dehydrogenase [Pseudomonadota bacterium]